MLPMDADDVARLAGQLDYPALTNQMGERLARLSTDKTQACYVAEEAGSVIGWTQVYGVDLLASSAPFAEIGGLVVDEKRRRQGIGTLLVEAAEDWARGRGYAHIRLRSGVQRTDAHQFYQRIGYTISKASYMFRKEL